MRRGPYTEGHFRVIRAQSIALYGRHPGMDTVTDAGAPLCAVRSGVVTFAGTEVGADREGRGITVMITDDGGDRVIYRHLGMVLAPIGTRVLPGDPIAVEGMSGDATARHTHIEVRRGPRPLSCAAYFGMPNACGLYEAGEYVPFEDEDPAESCTSAADAE